MADSLKVSQQVVQAEVVGTSGERLSHLLVQYEYVPAIPRVHTAQLLVQVEVAAYSEPPVVYMRKFPAPPTQRKLQSQTGKRKFPVVN